MLKLVEVLHILDHSAHIQSEQAEELRSQGPAWLRRIKGSIAARSFLAPQSARKLEAEAEAQLRRQAVACAEAFEVLGRGVLMLDEVDTILHPLRSELNWPLGAKNPLDFSTSKAGNGLRWGVPFHLLDALLPEYVPPNAAGGAGASAGASGGGGTAVNGKEAHWLRQSIRAVLEEGFEARSLQRQPHLTLLSVEFYHSKLKPLLARWAMLWLQTKKLELDGVSVDEATNYIANGPGYDRRVSRALQAGAASSDDHMKMLNLCHDWLQSYLPHVLAKVDRVSYGMLTPAQLKRCLALDPKTPMSRRLLAVPFVGKDVPSRASEFSHPDVVIGLTICAYR
jgi:hypothetical protein